LRGFCSRCGIRVGGLFRPTAWQCPRCRALLCEGCCPNKKVGLIFKKPVCPECLTELVEGGIEARPAR
jgi:hypothetical protein